MNGLDWKVPALVGGLITGVLSNVPIIGIANCCFCAWALVGGAVAAKMLVNRSPRPVKSGEGAKIGLIAGLIAAGINLFLGVIFAALSSGDDSVGRLLSEMAGRSNDPGVQEMMSRIAEMYSNMTPAQRFLYSLVLQTLASGVLGAFCVLGGLLGIALFEKRKELPPPSPYPPQYSPPYPPPSEAPSRAPSEGE
jgi:hypothetical protein